MGKTRERFKKIRDTKGTFHAKMGTIKDRNGMDLTSHPFYTGKMKIVDTAGRVDMFYQRYKSRKK